MSTQKVSTVFAELVPPRGLCERILARLALAHRRRARMYLALQSVVCFASGLLLVPLAQYAGQEVYTSGFYEYLSLFFSDRGIVLTSWQDLVYSLFESLPSMALLLLLTFATLLFWSLRRAIKNGRAAFSPLPHVA